MNFQSISNQLLFNTVRLVARFPAGRFMVSTGFLVATQTAKGVIPLLVTCAHSVQGAEGVELSCVRANAAGEPDLGKAVDFRLEKQDFARVLHLDAQLDVAAIPFGPLVNQAEAGGTPVVIRPISLDDNFLTVEQRAELNAIEDVIFVGYPKGLYDDVQILPLVRQGISASPIWADFQGKPRFIIDAEVFPGSSGSPVFILNQGSYPTKNGIAIGTRFHFVGMVIQAMNETDRGQQHIGLGVVLSAAAVGQYIRTVVNTLVK